MPSEMPTDIQRLIKRMLEARTDRAEEVIPDMAYGGIIGLQGGGPPRPGSRTPYFANRVRPGGGESDEISFCQWESTLGWEQVCAVS